MDSMEQRLEQALSRRHKKSITTSGLVRSAVLLPIFYKHGQYYLLFTKRTETVKYHKGQISFPGGAFQEEDGTLLNTALRESAEEIGLAPGDVKVIGALDDVVTSTSGYVISPFVAFIPYPYQFRVNKGEIEELIEAPLPILMDKSCVRQETEIQGKEVINGYSYHCLERVIWGATARILHQFLGILAQVMDD